jgi:hypothetical protein
VCDGRSKPISRDRAVARCILDKLDVAEEMAKSDTVCDWPGFSETPVPDVHAPNVVTGQYGSLF